MDALEADMQNDAHPGEERQPSMERRLATIMMADVAGYSRMMGENEERTVQTLRGHREIFDALLRLHRGRIFNTAGDAILAEFPSAVEAVRCATELQAALRTRNEHLPDEERMWFRIGINLGDVIVQGGDLLGDGVNVAARIQTIAEPGGICISGSVYDQIQNKLTLQFNLMGERSFKNIAQPVRTFSISEANGAAIPVALTSKKPPMMLRKFFIAVAAIVALTAVISSGYWMYHTYDMQRSEQLRLAIERERQTAEAQRKATDEKLADEAHQRQAVIEAEARERQAKWEAETQAAKAAMERAEAEKKRLDQELKRTAAEKHVAEPPIATKAPQAAKQGKTARFDGTYNGHLCTRPSGLPRERCWPVALKIEHGALSAAWTQGVGGKTSYAKGTISTSGSVTMTIDSWQLNGNPTDANLTGTWDNDTIHVSGTWKSGLPVTGNWKRGF
jgi:class 3 adenylate cyclase